MEFIMSKYGLPKGVKLQWKKGERPTGLMRVTESRRSWYLALKYPHAAGYPDERTVVEVIREAPDSWKIRLFCATGPNTALTARGKTADEARELGDRYVVANAWVWKQFIGESTDG
jgi:hypothetical protein